MRLVKPDDSPHQSKVRSRGGHVGSTNLIGTVI